MMPQLSLQAMDSAAVQAAFSQHMFTFLEVPRCRAGLLGWLGLVGGGGGGGRHTTLASTARSPPPPQSLGHQHVRMILRHIAIPHIRGCAVRHLAPWVGPALAALVPHIHQRLTAGWAAQSHQSGARAQPVPAPLLLPPPPLRGRSARRTYHSAQWVGQAAPSAPLRAVLLSCCAGPSTEDSASANEEIIRERLLRELTQEHANFLK